MDVAGAFEHQASKVGHYMTPMLWDTYVYKRDSGVPDLWDSLFEKRKSTLLYIAGRGFDVRVLEVLQIFMSSLDAGKYQVDRADLLLVGFSRYELADELVKLTEENAAKMKAMFAGIGTVHEITVGDVEGGEEVASTAALYAGNKKVISHIQGHTDIILDVSSLPRVVYLSLLTGILGKLIPDKKSPTALYAGGVNFQVLVAENVNLDAKIKSEDPGDELVLIPGFASAFRTESMSDWPMVWFPMLGENRESQFDKLVLLAGIPSTAEICPVLPHPSSNPRRSDDLLVRYRQQLFDSRETPASNIIYAHESNPFEAYRQILRAMIRYRNSLVPLGGCRLAVTPLSSKLMTLAAGMACFEMKPTGTGQKYAVAIPYAEPRRYSVPVSDLWTSSTLSCVLLTGEAYALPANKVKS
jgi:hypothetical protein